MYASEDFRAKMLTLCVLLRVYCILSHGEGSYMNCYNDSLYIQLQRSLIINFEASIFQFKPMGKLHTIQKFVLHAKVEILGVLEH